MQKLQTLPEPEPRLLVKQIAEIKSLMASFYIQKEAMASVDPAMT